MQLVKNDSFEEATDMSDALQQNAAGRQDMSEFVRMWSNTRCRNARILPDWSKCSSCTTTPSPDWTRNCVCCLDRQFGKASRSDYSTSTTSAIQHDVTYVSGITGYRKGVQGCLVWNGEGIVFPGQPSSSCCHHFESYFVSPRARHLEYSFPVRTKSYRLYFPKPSLYADQGWPKLNDESILCWMTIQLLTERTDWRGSEDMEMLSVTLCEVKSENKAVVTDYHLYHSC